MGEGAAESGEHAGRARLEAWRAQWVGHEGRGRHGKRAPGAGAMGLVAVVSAGVLHGSVALG